MLSACSEIPTIEIEGHPQYSGGLDSAPDSTVTNVIHQVEMRNVRTRPRPGVPPYSPPSLRTKQMPSLAQ
ncbi:unnamed protein product [Prorocentrum cordatum]|uniref:Uncharacterized protein n=1 Tax=Prorocentrum cordatum TaxID=2364126 RepID=A0ABN9W301_9DINO|nr:unnamed protein product [Polarella glacialis]